MLLKKQIVREVFNCDLVLVYKQFLHVYNLKTNYSIYKYKYHVVNFVNDFSYLISK